MLACNDLQAHAVKGERSEFITTLDMWQNADAGKRKKPPPAATASSGAAGKRSRKKVAAPQGVVARRARLPTR